MTHGATVSKFAIANLALRSAIQMEHMRRRERFDLRPIHDLACALDGTTIEDRSGGERVACMRAGFLEPFDRVYRSSSSAVTDGAGELENFVDRAADRLRAVDGVLPEGDLEEIVELCMRLHEEFIQFPAERGRSGRPERSLQTEAGVR
ncbi:MAG TPA: hypothetical protein VGC35_05920 [Allosphingosinicella sp.]|jgi:hypothetical protein